MRKDRMVPRDDGSSARSGRRKGPRTWVHTAKKYRADQNHSPVRRRCPAIFTCIFSKSIRRTRVAQLDTHRYLLSRWIERTRRKRPAHADAVEAANRSSALVGLPVIRIPSPPSRHHLSPPYALIFDSRDLSTQ